ncbi:hypothetical protein Vretimale_10571 [Volvox reticuliferus]|uniref:Bidirectional sugar transporter SWEET n=1 Tax=Volvox reticuliferus TaxID=1737510 RepID=A0A8J4GFN9_9CHLO|nr:hypothetical protein Vretifemale_12533 [Volvox reticuliferus]GIM06178.1 hypothetical protein Vretimale_10571 [Volvox reticuliferus]
MPSVILLNVVPAFGNLLASLMLISPVPAVLKLRATGKLGDLNPLPLPLTAYNSMGWLAYGIVTSNAYLFPSNLIGFVAGIFFTLTAHSAAPRQAQDRIMGIMLLGSVHFITMSIVALFGLTQASAERMWGTNAIVILMVYYIVPLSSMYDIVRRKNAISIYPPLACGAIANGGLWTVYGFALRDINLWLPNLFGAVIGVVQLILRAVYGAVPEPMPGVPTPVAPGAASPKAPLKPSIKGGPDGIEAPEQHPSAKHPAAKEPRRSSILMLLNPYHHASHEDVERGTGVPLSVVATASSTSMKPPTIQM